ncbi:UNVERIFIED_CONTAM: hypothetical protein FKN15_029467, partial [Acipenser sinensis]
NSNASINGTSITPSYPWLFYPDVFMWLSGCMENGAVILVLSFQAKRSTFLVYVFYLAVADFVFCGLMPIQLPASKVTCKMMCFLVYAFLYSSTLLIAAIVLERCLAIRHPIWHKCKRPKHTSASYFGDFSCLL